MASDKPVTVRWSFIRTFSLWANNLPQLILSAVHGVIEVAFAVKDEICHFLAFYNSLLV